MNKCVRQVAFACTVFLASFPLWGAGNNPLYSLELDALMNLERVSLGDYKHQILVVTVFEPQCPWCMKQFKALEDLYQNCANHLQPVAVGVGDKKGLKEIVYKTKISFPAAVASPDFIAMVGEPKATPFSLIIDDNGDLVTTIEGYVPLAKLRYAFQDVCLADAVAQTSISG
ncbi:redoxin family protein [Alteromonas sp. C1M14]|uniref:TlpA family protein disulfide reductase n=1 Tax=Alteromonas sp. C1M14 TaxID=2841567 RepID=UPI001C09E7DD|nr:redoxin family protein [Alteromonas sp. C1M14]MBU2978055.1 redoxin family protein [Alteromonas sp. C1M14]